MIAAPVVQEIQKDIFVVRDDLLIGGTKRCFLDELVRGQQEVVYASPAYGGAQIAIAHSARELGVQATIFVAKRAKPHARTLEAKKAGAKIMQVPCGYLTNVQAKAKAYCKYFGATLLPFGLETPQAFKAISARAQGVFEQVGRMDQVWSVAGSGVLTRGLQMGMEAAEFFAVQVGRRLGASDVGRAKIIACPQSFEEDAKSPPPFPSCSNYDAKAWLPFIAQGRGRRLFWNVSR